MLTYPIKGPWAGELTIIPRPRGGDWLEDEVEDLRKAGFDVVVSLLTRDEVEELGLTREEELIENQGLQFCNYPIRDLGVPSSSGSAQTFLKEMRRRLLDGERIALHCRASIGRAGLIASSLLVLSGVRPDLAFENVSVARSFPSPETEEQKAWVRALSQEPVASRA